MQIMLPFFALLVLVPRLALASDDGGCQLTVWSEGASKNIGHRETILKVKVVALTALSAKSGCENYVGKTFKIKVPRGTFDMPVNGETIVPRTNVRYPAGVNTPIEWRFLRLPT